MKIQSIFLAVVLAIALFFAAGCGPSKAGTTLTDADNGRTVTVNAGETLVVKLGGNPSTGYTWEAKDLDAHMLQQVGEPGFESFSPGLVGAGGTLTLTFKALKPGTTTLTLVYHRSWETNVAPLQTFTVTVTVQ